MLERFSIDDLSWLIKKCKRGDQQAWAEVIRRFSDYVYSIARRSGLTPEEAEDVFQSTFAALYKNLDRIESVEALPKWIGTTCSRESFRVHRLRSRDSMPLDEQLIADEQDIGEMVHNVERARLVRKSLGQIEEKCRELLTLLFAEDKVAYQTIADHLGISIGSIGPTRARCLDKLRSIVAKSGLFSESG